MTKYYIYLIKTQITYNIIRNLSYINSMVNFVNKSKFPIENIRLTLNISTKITINPYVIFKKTRKHNKYNLQDI